MINRGNWKLTKVYLQYRVEVDQIGRGSASLEKRWLHHLLEWADDKSFREAESIRPSFPVYLLSARRDGKEGQLSPEYVRKVVGSARRFFKWLAVHRRGYKSGSAAWLETLRVPKMTVEPGEHEAVTLGEVRAIAVAPVRKARERRIRAAAVFLFLSGVRVGAFVTLPLMAVDLDRRTVKQWPKLDVRTKFGKHATTHLLDIPDLLAVVREWDEEVRAVLPERGLWFAHLSQDGDRIDPVVREAGVYRRTRARKDLKDWLDRVGLPYHSPHKFRHGHAVYALKHCKDVADLKAVSQNLMHAHLSITDGIYGILSDDDVGDRIASLGNGKSSVGELDLAEFALRLEAIERQLEGKTEARDTETARAQR
jgi:integrase